MPECCIILTKILGTQKVAAYPENTADFMENMIQPRAEAGDVIIFTGVMQHCAMPNKSNASRTAILIQMLPKVRVSLCDISIS